MVANGVARARERRGGAPGGSSSEVSGRVHILAVGPVANLVPFVKLHAGILDSSIWAEPMPTRVVWIAMLAMADANGYVGASVSGLARRANVTRAECEAALACFIEPDEDSRTEDHDGRRIERVRGGWHLLNYQKFRAHRDAEARREYERDRKRAQRERSRLSRDNLGQSRESAQAEGEAEAEAEGDGDEEHRADLAERLDRASRIPIHDPLAAAHDPNTAHLLHMPPPRGCRKWGPTDVSEIHRQIQAHGIEHVKAVVLFVRASIEKRIKFDTVVAQPKHWSALWKYDGDAWDRRDKLYAEFAATVEHNEKAEQERKARDDEKEPDAKPTADLWTLARERGATK